MNDRNASATSRHIGFWPWPHIEPIADGARGHHARAAQTAKVMLVFTEDDAIVELLLCASDLARNGVEFPLTAAVEFLGMEYSEAALTAAYEAREVGLLYGEMMSADAFLEAAYRVMQGKGTSAR